jgi:hypothetical protein
LAGGCVWGGDVGRGRCCGTGRGRGPIGVVLWWYFCYLGGNGGGGGASGPVRSSCKAMLNVVLFL